MITVIPLAGRSQRFKDAGYKGHKALLPMPDGRPMLSHIVDSLKARIAVLPIYEKDLTAFQDWYINDALGNELRKSTVTSLLVLDHLTKGPLDTVLEAAEYLSDDELLVNYGDCWLSNTHYFLRRARMGHDAAVAVFDSTDKRYQYGRTGAFGGLAWFRSGQVFLNKAREIELTDHVGVPQVAQLFDNYGEINVTGMYTDLGTPEDYEAYLAKEGR